MTDRFTPCGGPHTDEAVCKGCGNKWSRYRGGSWDWEYKDCPSCVSKAVTTMKPPPKEKPLETSDGWDVMILSLISRAMKMNANQAIMDSHKCKLYNGWCVEVRVKKHEVCEDEP